MASNVQKPYVYRMGSFFEMSPCFPGKLEEIASQVAGAWLDFKKTPSNSYKIIPLKVSENKGDTQAKDNILCIYLGKDVMRISQVDNAYNRALRIETVNADRMQLKAFRRFHRYLSSKRFQEYLDIKEVERDEESRRASSAW